MNDGQAVTSRATLGELWRVRNAAAVTLALTEDQMRRAVLSAGVPELLELLDQFSPARAVGPEWARTFEPLIERLWAWRDDATMAVLAEAYRARGPAWMAVVNALSPEQGAMIRADLRHPAWARLPAFTVT
ncbi:MAG: hypothetical protein EXR05_09135 [Acetobacteraceae bacterium]|nr:hypothetical protein [Acetobacteraceae bacterium]